MGKFPVDDPNYFWSRAADPKAKRKMLGVGKNLRRACASGRSTSAEDPGHRRDVQGIKKCSLLKELQLSWRYLQPLPSLCSLFG
jgi:hypothetical protein